MAQKTILALRVGLLTLGLLSASFAFSEELDAPHHNYFVGIHGGGALPETSSLLNSGYVVGGEYGYRDDNYRTALQIDYTHNNFKSPTTANYSSADLMLSLFYDFNYQGSIVPFLGAGVGYINAWQNQCSTTLTNCNNLRTGNRFGYQGIAGLGFPVRNFRLDLRYRYISFINNNGFYQNIIELALDYYFPPR